MNLTNALLVVILLILLEQFHSEIVPLAVLAVLGVGIVYLGYWLIVLLPSQRRARRVTQKQEEMDEKEFWEYRAKHDAIRAEFDPKKEWNEATSVPQTYLKEVHDLNLKHSGMLQRRNGWTAEDFENHEGDS